jgi:hypothetical protein
MKAQLVVRLVGLAVLGSAVVDGPAAQPVAGEDGDHVQGCAGRLQYTAYFRNWMADWASLLM